MIRDSSLSLRMIFTRNVVWWIALSIVTPAVATRAQTLMPTSAPATAPGAAPEEETIIPTFETQKLARTYILDVPAPRGQITDRNGAPLAQNRLSYNLVINFPTPLDFSDAQALNFAKEKIDYAAKLIGRRLRISDDAILRHYRNRGIMPLEIAQNLSQQEYEKVKGDLPAGMMVRPIYVRTYPNGKVAGGQGKTRRDGDHRSEQRRYSRTGVLAHLRPQLVCAVDLCRATQNVAGRSEHSAFAASLSFVLPPWVDVQSCRGHCCTGSPCRLPGRPVPMRAGNSGRQCHFP